MTIQASPLEHRTAEVERDVRELVKASGELARVLCELVVELTPFTGGVADRSASFTVGGDGKVVLSHWPPLPGEEWPR